VGNVIPGFPSGRGKPNVKRLAPYLIAYIELSLPTWPNGLLTCKTRRNDNEVRGWAPVS
jgi:hypothetical protein